MLLNDLIPALVGGSLIGLAGGLLLLLQGRILGVSGIVSQSLRAPTQSGWRICFLLGLIVAPVALNMMDTNGLSMPELNIKLPATLAFENWQILLGAVLVGFGTKMGSGCTSGHGVCGIGRLSVRSIVATAVFMLTAIVTVFVIRHTLA